MHMCEVTLVGKIPRCTDIQQAMVFSPAHCIGTTWYTDKEPLSTAVSIIQSEVVSMSETRASFYTMFTLYAFMYVRIMMYVIKIFLKSTRQPHH